MTRPAKRQPRAKKPVDVVEWASAVMGADPRPAELGPLGARLVGALLVEVRMLRRDPAAYRETLRAIRDVIVAVLQ